MPDTNATRIGFRSLGKWSVADCASFAVAVSGIYDALLATRVQTRLDEAYREFIDRSLRRLEGMAGGPFAQELYMFLREWRKHGAPGHLASLAFMYGPVPRVGVEEEHRDVYQLYRNIDVYASDVDRLRIFRIHMASPGGFSFEGIGELIGQLRELVKDIWYRNRQERIRGELEIIERYLHLRTHKADIGLPPAAYQPTSPRLVKTVARHVREIKRLEEQGKLGDVVDNLDYEPPD